MSLNVPSGDVNQVSFGPAILYVGAAGTTPSVQVGYVNEAKFQYTRKRLALMQGMPQVTIKTWAIEESATVTVEGLQTDLIDLQKSIGAGTISGSSLGVGGDSNMANYAVMLQHTTPAGHTIYLDMFFTEKDGDFSWNFGNGFHTIPFSFKCLETQSDWAGNALSAGTRQFRVRRITA